MYDKAIDITDPGWNLLEDDASNAEQLVTLALGTERGGLDGFPEYGADIRAYLLKGMSPRDLAMLPLEIRSGLEQEPAFEDVEVVIVSGPPDVSAAISITGAEGDQVGFTLPLSSA